MSDKDIQQITENKTNIEGLKGDVGSIFEWMRRLEDKVDRAIEAAMKRPGWAVCMIISILLAGCAILGTLLAAHIKSGG